MNPVTAPRSGEQDIDELVSTVQLVRLAGITYRQANHWATKGYLRPEPRPAGATGTGIPMRFTLNEVAIAQRIGELTRIGLAVQIAALYARQAPLDADRLLEMVRKMPLP